MRKFGNDLGQLQRWMQSVIMHPGGVLRGVASQEARRHIDVGPEKIETVISPSRAQTSVERLEIYAHAYYARLLECMRAEFPVLVRAMGEELFDEFAVGYLESYPSRSYTLNHLGENFARHLEETRPDEPGWPAFLVDLARLEWIFSEVFDGPGVENRKLLDPKQLEGIPPERWPDVRLVPVPCLRLVSLGYPVHRYYRALRKDPDTRPPEPGQTFLAVTRRDYIVRHYDLSATQHALLTGLVAGEPLGEALARAAEADDRGRDALALDLGDWFRRWSAEGFFLSAELRSP